VPGRDRILGVTIVGVHAGDLLAEYVLAMKHGLGLNKILGTIHSYPTLAEANKYAAGEWKRAHAPQRVLRWPRSSMPGAGADRRWQARSPHAATAACVRTWRSAARRPGGPAGSGDPDNPGLSTLPSSLGLKSDP